MRTEVQCKVIDQKSPGFRTELYCLMFIVNKKNVFCNLQARVRNVSRQNLVG